MQTSFAARATLTIGAAYFALVLVSPPVQGASQAKSQPVPKASCGPQDRTESVQGQTTFAERFAPGPAKAFNCNLELVGQFAGEGTSAALEVADHCVYYSTLPNPNLSNPGAVVLDVSDPRQPKVATYLRSPAMLDPLESLKVDASRKLLLANKFGTTTFDLYELTPDCRQPILRSSLALPRTMSHLGQFVADGRTYYASSWGGPGDSKDPAMPPESGIFAIDISNPAAPATMATWIPENKDWKTHGVSVSDDGTQVYVALLRFNDDEDPSPHPNGLVILDSGDVQARRPNPQFRVLSSLFWDDVHFAEVGVPVKIAGKPYLVWADLVGAVGFIGSPPPNACASGKPGYGYARIIDIGDARNPRTISKLMLEVSDPANCSKVMYDPTNSYGYGAFACDVDDAQNAKLLACGYFEGGLRVFDIRRPARPREVAYYKPPARRTEARPGNAFRTTFMQGLAKGDHTADQVLIPRFKKDRGEIWFISADNGFQVVRFSDRFKSANPGLFKD